MFNDFNHLVGFFCFLILDHLYCMDTFHGIHLRVIVNMRFQHTHALLAEESYCCFCSWNISSCLLAKSSSYTLKLQKIYWSHQSLVCLMYLIIMIGGISVLSNLIFISACPLVIISLNLPHFSDLSAELFILTLTNILLTILRSDRIYSEII